MTVQTKPQTTINSDVRALLAVLARIVARVATKTRNGKR